MHPRFTESELRAQRLLTVAERQIYSVGVNSTAVFELDLLERHLSRHVVASNIDTDVLERAQKAADARRSWHRRRLELANEDISGDLTHRADNSFDFVYARLVLHYLPRLALGCALGNIHRILRPNGRLFAVVRAADSPDAKQEGTAYDPETGLTTYIGQANPNVSAEVERRYFHTEESFSTAVGAAGLRVATIASYEERIFANAERSPETQATNPDSLIEIVAFKRR